LNDGGARAVQAVVTTARAKPVTLNGFHSGRFHEMRR
jgi:hypothetical protein